MTTTADESKSKKKRGFAAIDPKKLREISSKGGKTVHANGTGRQFTSEEAREAGRKGGKAPHVSRGKPRPSPDSAA